MTTNGTRYNTSTSAVRRSFVVNCLNTVSTPVLLSQHLLSQHLFERLNTCYLSQVGVFTSILILWPRATPRSVDGDGLRRAERGAQQSYGS